MEAKIRKLVVLGYLSLMKKKALEKYISGRITFSEAAELSNLTIWEMEQYLVSEGFKSDYSLDDLERELTLLKEKK